MTGLEPLRDLSPNEIRDLPDEKLEELWSAANTAVGECPDCGEETVFIGTPGYTSTSECPSCGHEETI